MRHFASGPQARQIGAASQIDHHAAATIMRRRHHRDRLGGAIDIQLQQPRVDGGKMLADEIAAKMGEIEQHMFQPQPLHFGIDGARHHIARRQFQPIVVSLHEAAAVGQFQLAAFAARRFGDQEIAHFGVKQAGWVELVEFHVGNPAAGAPGHGDAVAGRAIGVGGI